MALCAPKYPIIIVWEISIPESSDYYLGEKPFLFFFCFFVLLVIFDFHKPVPIILLFSISFYLIFHIISFEMLIRIDNSASNSYKYLLDSVLGTI